MRLVAKCKFNSYAVKNASAPGVKAEKFKAKTLTFDSRKSVPGIKDHRKYKNDKSLSEAEKVALRMDQENIKNTLKHTGFAGPLFSNSKNEKEWETDPMLLKVKQLSKFDEGLNESSDDDEDNAKEDSGKYFSNGKKTKEDIIRESKIKKEEKKIENRKIEEKQKNLDVFFKETFVHKVPGIIAAIKAKSDKKKEPLKDDFDFENSYQNIIMAPKPALVEKRVEGLGNSEKKNEKLVNIKVTRLREHLIKSKLIAENDDEELNISDLESSGSDNEGESADVSDSEVENDDSEMDEECSKNTGNESDEECSENTDNESAEECSRNTDNESDDDNSSSAAESCGDSKEVVATEVTINDLKSTIAASRGMKRKLSEDEIAPQKRVKIESDKNEVDCFRILLEMELKKEAMLVMSSEVDSPEWDMDNVVRKLVLAAIFQNTLKTCVPHSYSPELVRFLRLVLVKSSRDSDHWLAIKSDLSNTKKEKLLNICTAERDTDVLALSVLFHSLRLIKEVVIINRKLPSNRSLFTPLRSVVEGLSKEFYPEWLNTEIESLCKELDVVDSLPLATMTMKRAFKIVELLEPDLDDKFDPKKDVTKMLKLKVKNEKKSLKKDIKLAAKARVNKEAIAIRKAAEIRDKKTLAILNNLNQT